MDGLSVSSASCYAGYVSPGPWGRKMGDEPPKEDQDAVQDEPRWSFEGIPHEYPRSAELLVIAAGGPRFRLRGSA